MTPFVKNGGHSRGRSFKSLYLNPLNELKYYGDGGSGEINLHLYESSADEFPVLPFPSERGKQPKKDDGGCASSGRNCKIGLFDKRKGLIENSSFYLADTNHNMNWFFENNANQSGSKCVWDDSGSVTAPASAWSTLPKRSLLYRTLPADIGSCSCYIVRERPEGRSGFSLYTFYTNEGQGRVDRRLAVAYHRRKWGRSEFIIAQNSTGIKCRWDESFIGTVTANLMGSCYHIWDQSSFLDSPWKDSKQLVAIAVFLPTVTTLTGSFRRMHAYVPKCQSMHAKYSLQGEDSRGLPVDWEGNVSKVHHLFSRIPSYNKTSKQHELDFRERTKSDICIQASSKNFQLMMKEDDGKTLLLLGKIGKSKYLVDYRYPLTAYQAFAICLASIDSKLCYCI